MARINHYGQNGHVTCLGIKEKERAMRGERGGEREGKKKEGEGEDKIGEYLSMREEKL